MAWGAVREKIASAAVEGKKKQIESDPARDDSSARGDAADDSKAVNALKALSRATGSSV
jgi:hypothetical protein